MELFAESLVSKLDEIIIGTTIWFGLMYLTDPLSYSIGAIIPTFSKSYSQLDTMKKRNWRIRMVGFIHAIVISAMSLYVLVTVNELYEDKIFASHSNSEMILLVTSSFFLWDIITIVYYGDFGAEFLVHAVASFLVFFFSFWPFAQYFGLVFLLFEMSTPFLHMNWFFDKMNMTGSVLQLINAVFFVLVFFSVRLVFGLYFSLMFFMESYKHFEKLPIMISFYWIANLVMNTLNIYWFSLIMPAITSRLNGNTHAIRESDKRLST